MQSKQCSPIVMRLVVALLAFITSTPVVGLAEPNRSPTDSVSVARVEVTWKDIIKVVDKHPRMKAGRHRVAAALYGVDAAGAVPNPSIEATTSYGQAVDDSATRAEWGLSLSIPLEWIAQRGAKMDAARADARVVEAEVEALRRDVLLQLRIMFWKLVYMQERVEALTELNSQTSALAQTVKRRVQQGDVRPVEVTRIEIEAEKISGELEFARFELKTQQVQLATWLGVHPVDRVVAVADLTHLVQPMTTGQAIQKALFEHPAIIAAKVRVQALSAHAVVEYRERVPAVAIEAFTDHELDRRAYGVGLSIELPLWNWNNGRIQRLERLLAAGKKQLQVERLEIENLVSKTQSMCDAGVALAMRYKDRILPRTQSTAQTIERTYQLGEATLLDVIDARRTLLDTKRQFLSALVQAQIDCSHLCALAGEEL